MDATSIEHREEMSTTSDFRWCLKCALVAKSNSPQHLPSVLSSLDQAWRRYPPLDAFHLFGCALCRTELRAPALVRPLPWGLDSLLYRYPRLYGFVVEMHSFLHRMAYRCRRPLGALNVLLPPLSEVGEDGLRVPNIRTRACIDDMRNYAEVHPWATILDLDTYRDAWLAGAERTENNSCRPDRAVPEQRS